MTVASSRASLVARLRLRHRQLAQACVIGGIAVLITTVGPLGAPLALVAPILDAIAGRQPRAVPLADLAFAAALLAAAAGWLLNLRLTRSPAPGRDEANAPPVVDGEPADDAAAAVDDSSAPKASADSPLGALGRMAAALVGALGRMAAALVGALGEQRGERRRQPRTARRSPSNRSSRALPPGRREDG
jgi:hypothetical protein